MTIATREELLRTSRFKTKDCDLEGWGAVRIRELTAKQLSFLAKLDKADQEEAGRVYSRLAAMSLVDGDNGLLFDPDNAADIEALQGKPWSSLETMAAEVIAFNGFGEKDVEGRSKN